MGSRGCTFVTCPCSINDHRGTFMSYFTPASRHMAACSTLSCLFLQQAGPVPAAGGDVQAAVAQHGCRQRGQALRQVDLRGCGGGWLRKALGAQCRHAKVINALQRAAWGQRQPLVPSDCGACESVLHMMQDAKAALQMGRRLECQNVCSH